MYYMGEMGNDKLAFSGGFIMGFEVVQHFTYIGSMVQANGS